MRVALDFAACWHSRVTARFSEYLKELSRDESLTDRAVRTDSGTTRFLSQTDLKRQVKNNISHRARACRALSAELRAAATD